MRYFRVDPYPNRNFVSYDGFSYCKISKDGRMHTFSFGRGQFTTRLDYRAKIEFHGICDRLRYNGDTVDYKYVNIVEELTKKEFDKVLKSNTYLKEITA